jgi:hypothetical protein
MWQPVHFRLLAVYQLRTASFSFPALHFWLFPQILCALLKTTNGFDSYPNLQGESVLCTIAHECISNLKDDSVRNGCQSIEKEQGISTLD